MKKIIFTLFLISSISSYSQKFSQVTKNYKHQLILLDNDVIENISGYSHVAILDNYSNSTSSITIKTFNENDVLIAVYQIDKIENAKKYKDKKGDSIYEGNSIIRGWFEASVYAKVTIIDKGKKLLLKYKNYSVVFNN